MLQPRVTASLPIGRQGRSSSASPPVRYGPIRVRGFDVTNPRRRVVHREEDLRSAPSRRPSKDGPGEHGSQPRPPGGHLRAGRIGLTTSRSSKSSRALRRRRGTTASVDARRLATAPGSSAVSAFARKGESTLIGLWKMLDNLRRSLSAPAAFLAGGRMDDAAPASAAVWTACVL